jgi:hypothetical protein
MACPLWPIGIKHFFCTGSFRASVGGHLPVMSIAPVRRAHVRRNSAESEENGHE